MLKKDINIEEIPELQRYIKEQQEKDIQVCSHSGRWNLRLIFRPPTSKYIVLDLSGDRHAEWHYDTIEEAVDKYNAI